MMSARLQQPVVNLKRVAAALLCGMVAASLVALQTTSAAPGINETLSFSARLATSTGAAIPDGSYNLRFKLYEGDTQLWSESYLDSNRAEVRNGYISVSLGSLNPFADHVDWNQDNLTLGLNIGGSESTPDWDGELTSRFTLTTVPQAFNTKHLGGLTSDQYVQLGQGEQTVDSSETALHVNQTGAGALINLQSDGASALYVSNSGVVGIGTDSPSAKLTVEDAGNDLEVLVTTGSSGVHTDAILRLSTYEIDSTRTAIRFERRESGVNWYAGVLHNTGFASREDFVITSTGSTLAAAQLILRTNGNVGIGTNTPTQALQVSNGNISATAGYIAASQDLYARNGVSGQVVIGLVSSTQGNVAGLVIGPAGLGRVLDYDGGVAVEAGNIPYTPRCSCVDAAARPLTSSAG